jgi:V-type H+-transporting ATPase subunit d
MLEGLLRGFRSGFLKEVEFRQLTQCEKLDDIKLALSDTDYQQAMQSLQPNPEPSQIAAVARKKFIDEFKFIRSQAVGQLATFLDMVTYEDLIMRVCAVMRPISQKQDAELSAEDDIRAPLGYSPHLKSMLAFDKFDPDNFVDLYRTVLVEMPIGQYFAAYFFQTQTNVQSPGQEIQRVFQEVDIQLIEDMLRKLWLEDFYVYCQELGGETAVMMAEILEFEADRRAIEIMFNSIDMKTSLNDPSKRDAERKALFCHFGKLYPEATLKTFSQVSTLTQLGQALENYPEYHDLWRAHSDGNQDLTNLLREYETKLCRYAFDSQSHFASFYAWTKLSKLQVENLRYICDMRHSNNDATDAFIKLF